MSEYKIIKNYGMSYITNSNGELIMFYVKNSDADKTAKLLNEETKPLHDTIAELEAALEDARTFIRGTFPLEHPSDIRYANKDAEMLMASWQASENVADVAVESEKPTFQVGDKVRIKWADYLHGKYEVIEAFDGTVYALKDIPVVFESLELEPYSEESEKE